MALKLDPMKLVTGWRFLQLALLVHLWMMGEQGTASFVFIFLLFIMTALRWRFRLPIWTVVADIVICLSYFPITSISYYGLALPIFELALKGRWLLSLVCFACFAIAPVTSLMFWNNVQAVMFGSFASLMLHMQQAIKREADEQRQARSELESLNKQLLEANRSVAQKAKLMERYRISRQLHDHLGHDLTGAALALQAYDYMEDGEEAEKLLQEVKLRLERSTASLRETVHNVTPTAWLGVESLEQIASSFHQCPVRFQKSGNLGQLDAYSWELLEACLKEALTNIARHSDATEVVVDLQATDSFLRLSIKDNGSLNKGEPAGTGLRGLRARARAHAGSISVNREDGYHIVCVLPVGKQGGEAE